MFVVRASVNGTVGNFILDTGAPGIVLNSKDESKKKTHQGASINGTLAIGEVEVNDFQLGNIHKQKAQGHVLNVQHLETACGMDIMGLIGYDVLRNYELLFDFPNKKIQAYKSGSALTRQSQKPRLAIPFTLCGHVPVIVAKIGGKRAFFGLDSGAEVNLMDKRFYEKIDPKQLTGASQEMLTGIDNTTQFAMAANVAETQVRGEALPGMRYVFTDLGRLRKDFDAPLDGLLGVPFFEGKVVSIDYGKKKIYIW